jgi:glycosyltransferase involved in cell wall biosynthesis
MAQALNHGSTAASASYFYLTDLKHLDNLADFADSLVIFRSPYDTDVDRVITRFRRAGKKVFFDVDDLIFDSRFAPLVTSNLNYELFGKEIAAWFSFISNVGSALSLCDHVITTNSYIAERVKEFAGLPVSVVPNFINQEQRTVSDKLFEARNPKTGPGLSIGYFSGSHSHAKDFAVAEKGIVDFLQESPSSTLTLLGHFDLTDGLEKVRNQIVRKPFMNFMELQSAIADVDVSLSPLQSSPFTFSKSELKFFEAAVVGTVTVATPTPVFTQAINHEVSGYLSGASQWSEQLHTIAALTSAQRDSITREARTSALQNYTGEALATTIEALFFDAK